MAFLDFDPAFALGADPADVAAAFTGPPSFDIGAIEQASNNPALAFQEPEGLVATIVEGARQGIFGQVVGGALTALSLVPLVNVVAAPLSVVQRAAGAVRAVSQRGPSRADAPSRLNPEDVGSTRGDVVANGIFSGITDFLGGVTGLAGALGTTIGAVQSVFNTGPNSGAVAAAPANATGVGFVGAEPAILRLPMPLPRLPAPIPRVPAPRRGGTLPPPIIGDIFPGGNGMNGNGAMEICRPATRRGTITQYLQAYGYNWRTAYRLIRLIGPEVASGVLQLDIGSTSFILAHPPRRRGAGISATDIRRTRSTLSKLNRLQKLCAPVRRRR